MTHPAVEKALKIIDEADIGQEDKIVLRGTIQGAHDYGFLQGFVEAAIGARELLESYGIEFPPRKETIQ